jgi:polyribonucleotide nucleotidyltransferase
LETHKEEYCLDITRDNRICHTCDGIFQDEDNLNGHISIAHYEECRPKSKKCKKCGQKVKNTAKVKTIVTRWIQRDYWEECEEEIMDEVMEEMLKEIMKEAVNERKEEDEKVIENIMEKVIEEFSKEVMEESIKEAKHEMCEKIIEDILGNIGKNHESKNHEENAMLRTTWWIR